MLGTPTQVVHSVEPEPPSMVVLESAEPPSMVVLEDVSLLCNCYAYAKSKIPELQNTSKITPNTDIEVGTVAIFKYPSGVKHYAIVKSVSKESFVVDESNYKRCVQKDRTVSIDDKYLLGFYKILV